MFETFNVPALYITTPAVLSLYASGCTTGLVLDSGQDMSLSVPVYEGHTLKYAINKQYLAGRDLTDYLVVMLLKQGYALSGIKREIVEKKSDNFSLSKKRTCSLLN